MGILGMVVVLVVMEVMMGRWQEAGAGVPEWGALDERTAERLEEWEALAESYDEGRVAEMRGRVAEMFSHAWQGYVRHAEPADELQPVSCTGRRVRSRGTMDDILGNFSLTLVDTLDALPVFGMPHDFHRAVWAVVEHVSFAKDLDVSLFEVNIRLMGGLLSAHLLAIGNTTSSPSSNDPPPNSGSDSSKSSSDGNAKFSFSSSDLVGDFKVPGYKGELLELARDLGDRLLPAFSTGTGIPYSRVNLLSGVTATDRKKGEVSKNCLAGAGTLLLEFGMLSKLTGSPVYFRKAHAALRRLWRMRTEEDLLAELLEVNTGHWSSVRASIGAGSDSFYEYLLKANLLFGELDSGESLQAFDAIYRSLHAHSLKHGWFLPTNTRSPGAESSPVVVDALQDFWPALQVLYGDVDEALRTYRRHWQLVNAYGFPPENFWPYPQTNSGSGYPLRPEFIESTYFLYRATRDPFFLAVGEMAVNELQARCRTSCGFGAIRDVSKRPEQPSDNVEDVMDSFFLTETLKYLYLLFSDDSHFLHSRNYLFTTEAHMFPLLPEFQAPLVASPEVRRPCFPASDFYAAWPSYIHYLANFSSPPPPAIPTESSSSPSSSPPSVTPAQPVALQAPAFLAPEEFADRQSLQQERVAEALNRLSEEYAGQPGVVIELITGASFILSPLTGLQRQRDLELSRALERIHQYRISLISSYEYVDHRPVAGSVTLSLTDGTSFASFSGSGALFGPDFDAAAIPPTRYRLVEGPACGEIAQDLLGRIAVISRGECTFVEKVIAAEAAGAVAAIIYNNVEDNIPFRMSGKPDDSSIPGVFISNQDAERLLSLPDALVAFDQQWSVPMNSADSDTLYFRMHPTHPTNIASLTDIYSATIVEAVQQWISLNINQVLPKPLDSPIFGSPNSLSVNLVASLEHPIPDTFSCTTESGCATDIHHEQCPNPEGHFIDTTAPMP
ncbi:MAG: glycoside hydrolase family 47 protein [archaeon]|nr:glycoside hydrolase family 47 protein [archaeon]